MVNKKVDQFIRACTHFQLVNSCFCEAKHMLCKIDYDTPFDVVLLDFCEPKYIPDQDIFHKTLVCQYFMIGFGLLSSSGLKEIAS